MTMEKITDEERQVIVDLVQKYGFMKRINYDGGHFNATTKSLQRLF